MTFGTHPV